MTVINSRFLEKNYSSYKPDRPEIISPIDGVENINQCPQFICSEYNHYYNEPAYAKQIQICEDISFENNIYDKTEHSKINVFNVPLDDDNSYLQPDTIYYARIRYQDKKQNWSEWSEIISFKTLSEFPEIILATPSIIAPVNGSIASLKNPVLAMTTPTAIIGEATFDSADWQISNDENFETTLYSAENNENLTLHITENVDLSNLEDVNFYARARQHTTNGLYTDWSAPAHFTRRLEYDNPIFGLRRIFSTKYSRPYIYQIDENGNPIHLSKEYFDRHPLYAFPVSEISIIDDITSSVAYVAPCWIKHNVYDNEDGDMVIDLWFSPYAKYTDGWILHPAFVNSPSGFLHGTCLCSIASATIDGTSSDVLISKYNKSATSLYNATTCINNLQNLDKSWHLWNIYEKMLLFTLMQAEFHTFSSQDICYVENGSNNKDNTYLLSTNIFTWRCFRCIAGYQDNGKIIIDGMNNLPRQATSGTLSSVDISTPDMKSTITLDTNLSLASSTYITKIARGFNDNLGFDVALLGIPSENEKTIPSVDYGIFGVNKAVRVYLYGSNGTDMFNGIRTTVNNTELFLLTLFKDSGNRYARISKTI